jgi:hypothetical protein
MTITCDFCDAETPFASRWAHLTPRPSDPTEVVATLWTCPPCGEQHGLIAVTEAERLFDEDYATVRERWGDRVAFLTA